ncbi:MAG TPA: hypothetical protein VKG24_01870 [Pseudolabrys sp.]|nr:hypothetical protein [Pseudolabrys sp.]
MSKIVGPIRRWRSEGFHGEAKSWHGLARAVRRGLTNLRTERPIKFYFIRPSQQGRQSQRLILRKLPSSRSMVTVLQPPRILSREYRQS